MSHETQLQSQTGKVPRIRQGSKHPLGCGSSIQMPWFGFEVTARIRFCHSSLRIRIVGTSGVRSD